jgi:hypothetical protein
MRMAFPQALATSASCVTTNSVAPRSAANSVINAMAARAFTWSSDPVGSSANTNAGPWQNARARAQR